MWLKKDPKPKKPIWQKMRRYTAYFTIIGATLAAFRYHIIHSREVLPRSAQSDPFFREQMESLQSADHNTFYFLCAFTALSFSLFLLSYCMLKKERSS